MNILMVRKILKWQEDELEPQIHFPLLLMNNYIPFQNCIFPNTCMCCALSLVRHSPGTLCMCVVGDGRRWSSVVRRQNSVEQQAVYYIAYMHSTRQLISRTWNRIWNFDFVCKLHVLASDGDLKKKDFVCFMNS